MPSMSISTEKCISSVYMSVDAHVFKNSGDLKILDCAAAIEDGLCCQTPPWSWFSVDDSDPFSVEAVTGAGAACSRCPFSLLLRVLLIVAPLQLLYVISHPPPPPQAPSVQSEVDTSRDLNVLTELMQEQKHWPPDISRGWMEPREHRLPFNTAPKLTSSPPAWKAACYIFHILYITDRELYLINKTMQN